MTSQLQTINIAPKYIFRGTVSFIMIQSCWSIQICFNKLSTEINRHNCFMSMIIIRKIKKVFSNMILLFYAKEVK